MPNIKVTQRIYDRVKEEAEKNYRSIAGQVEYMLYQTEKPTKPLTSGLFPGDSPEAKSLGKQVESVFPNAEPVLPPLGRTKAEIKADIDARIAQTKEDLEYCQDPDERRRIEQASQAEVNALWEEYHNAV